MTDLSKQLRIGYLPFYVDYYEGLCSDFPQEKLAVAKHCAKTLERFGQVVWDGQLLKNVTSAKAAGRRMARKKVDCVVVVTTIAVFGGICWAALQSLHVPILIWNPQQIRQVGKGYSMVEIVRNTGQIGTQALANTLLRQGRWFRVVTGYEKSRRTSTDLKHFFQVIHTVVFVQKARLLNVGGCFPQMTDIAIDEEALARQLGPEVTHVTANTLTRAYARVPNARVQSHLQTLRQKRYIGLISEDELERSIRLCEALDDLVVKHHVDAGTLNCHGANCLRNKNIGITACYSLGVQNDQGRPFTCTGDLPTAIAMLIVKQLTGCAMYTEVQVMDEIKRAVVIANSGEGEACIRRPGSRLTVTGNTNFVGVHGRGASFAYPLKAGPATLVSFTPMAKGKQAYRLVVAEGHILKDRLPDAGALAGFFRFAQTDLTTAYTRWLESGSVHHAATTTGHWARQLRNVADLLNIEFVGV